MLSTCGGRRYLFDSKMNLLRCFIVSSSYLLLFMHVEEDYFQFFSVGIEYCLFLALSARFSSIVSATLD